MPEYEVAELLGETPSRVWESDNGTVSYYRVKLTDGVLAECGKKKGLPQVGDKYQVLRQASKPEFLPTLQKPVGFQGGGGGKSYEADPRKLRAENARSALHAAKDLVVAEKLPLEQMGTYTEKLYGYITKHAEGS